MYVLNTYIYQQSIYIIQTLFTLGSDTDVRVLMLVNLLSIFITKWAHTCFL